MLGKTTVLMSESFDVNNPDDNFQEQGFVWLCAACENQPTFETVYDLFHHKKTHGIEFNKNENTLIKSEEFSNFFDSAENDNLVSNKSLRTDFDEKESQIPQIESPVPSCSSEDIPLASLLLDSLKVKEPVKKSKKIKKKVRNKNLEKFKNAVVQKNENASSDPIIKTEKSAQDETSIVFPDIKEKKENQDIDNIDSYTSENERKTEESKEEKNSLSAKAKVKHFCKICYTEFPSRFDLSAHKITHLFEDTGCYKCETCGRLCPKYDNFTRHLTIHFTNRQKNHQCSQCFASFYNYADLKRHLVLHLDVKPYKCKHCGEGFIRLDNLLIHEYKHTGIQYKKFACKDCDKVLNSPSALVMHAKTHSERTVFCPEPGCKFSCYLQSQLRQHTRKHSGEKPFQCAKCGRCFARSNDMKNHVLNVHEGVKPFKCSSCPKKFALIGNLKNHKITHTNERPFLCAQCGKSFNQSSTLRKHSIIMHNPSRANGKQKKSKKASKRCEVPKINKPKECLENQIRNVKYKIEKTDEGEVMMGVKTEKAELESSFIVPGTASITAVTPTIVQEISKETQIKVPQIAVNLPIQVNHSQTFMLPTVILERCIIRTETFTKNGS